MKRIYCVLSAILLASSLVLANDHGADDGVPADKALGWLKNGNVRYLKGGFRKDGKSAADRKRLSSGQKPHTIVISCADSRVPPEIVFDQGLGEIFVIRAAGEALDSSVIASAEYAASHLGSKLILVMGHSSCGAVKAALETKSGESAGSPDLDKLVGDIKPRLPASEKPSDLFITESTANAKGVAADLVKRSAIIKKLVSDGKVTIKSALYHLGTGEVNFHE